MEKFENFRIQIPDLRLRLSGFFASYGSPLTVLFPKLNQGPDVSEKPIVILSIV